MAGEPADATGRVTPTESTLELLDPRPLAPRHWAGLAGLLLIGLPPLTVVIGPAPQLVDRITMIRLTVALFIAMFAMSWDVVSGYTGELSFGHAFFFALGGYTTTVLSLTVDWHPFATIALGVLVAALGGVLVGVPALRVTGPYLSLLTLIAPILLLQVFIMYSGTFGGETGLRNPRPIVGSVGDPVIAVESRELAQVADFYVAYGLFVFVLVVLLAVTRSNAGAVFYAIRSGEEVVSATGKNPAKFKVFVFVLSAAIGGLAGSVFVHTSVGQATPGEILNIELSLLVIIASVLGGMGTIVGAAIGGLFIHLVEVAVLDGVDVTVPYVGHTVGDMSFLFVGVVGLAIVYLLPGGMLRWSIERGAELRERYENRRPIANDTDERTP